MSTELLTEADTLPDLLGSRGHLTSVPSSGVAGGISPSPGGSHQDRRDYSVDDVLDAAPQLLREARELVTSRREFAQPALFEMPESSPASVDFIAGLNGRVGTLQNRLSILAAEQKYAFDVMRSLADDNARIVKAIDALRARAVELTYVCGGLSLVVCALLAWIAFK